MSCLSIEHPQKSIITCCNLIEKAKLSSNSLSNLSGLQTIPLNGARNEFQNTGNFKRCKQDCFQVSIIKLDHKAENTSKQSQNQSKTLQGYFDLDID